MRQIYKFSSIILLVGVISQFPSPCESAGIATSDVYASLEYWKAGDYAANPLCRTAPTLFPTGKANTYPYRAGAGLKSFASNAFDAYSRRYKGSSIYDLSYAATQQPLDKSWNGVVTCATASPALANAQNAELSKADTLPSGKGVMLSSLGQGVCSCVSSLTPTDMCYSLGNYSQETLCYDTYEYDDAARVAEVDLSPDNDFGWSLPSECLNPVSDGVYPQDLPLTNYIIDGNVPDELQSSNTGGEGKTFYMLHKAIDHLTRYAEYLYIGTRFKVANLKSPRPPISKDQSKKLPMGALYEDNLIFSEILPEWKVLRVFYLTEPMFNEGPTTGRFPMAVIASRNADILIVFRNPITTTDGRLALYNQQAFKNLYNFTGQVHDGGGTIYQAMMGVLDFTLADFYDQYNVSGQHPRVVITAEGLPYSSAAAVVATHIAKKFIPMLQPELLDVSLVIFGDTLVGNGDFVNSLRSKVNIRNVVLEGDSASVFPCPTTWSCNEDVLLPRTGVETGKQYTYTPLPGKTVITLEQLSKLDPYWGEAETLFDLAALRYCGYTCFLQSQFCHADPDSRCNPQQCMATFT